MAWHHPQMEGEETCPRVGMGMGMGVEGNGNPEVHTGTVVHIYLYTMRSHPKLGTITLQLTRVIHKNKKQITFTHGQL